MTPQYCWLALLKGRTSRQVCKGAACKEIKMHSEMGLETSSVSIRGVWSMKGAPPLQQYFRVITENFVNFCKNLNCTMCNVCCCRNMGNFPSVVWWRLHPKWTLWKSADSWSVVCAGCCTSTKIGSYGNRTTSQGLIELVWRYSDMHSMLHIFNMLHHKSTVYCTRCLPTWFDNPHFLYDRGSVWFKQKSKVFLPLSFPKA